MGKKEVEQELLAEPSAAEKPEPPEEPQKDEDTHAGRVVEFTAPAPPPPVPAAPPQRAQLPAVQQPVRPVLSNRGIVLENLGYKGLIDLSERVARSGLAPKAFDNKPEACFVAIVAGAELGMPPMMALRHIAVINGKPGLYGDGVPGIILGSGVCEYTKYWYEGTFPNDEFKCICESKRRGKESAQVEYSIADAKRAKLWGKEGPWTTSPKRMLKWRACGFNWRDEFPDVLCGMRIIEEMRDDEPLDIEATVKDLPPTEGREKFGFAKAKPVQAAAPTPDPFAPREPGQE
jgi:hypothetical protein